MANPTDEISLPAVILADTTEASITLHPDRMYWLYHDGEDGSGNANTETIYFKFDSDTVDGDQSEGENKLKLMDGRDVLLGAGVTTLYFKTASADVTFTIVPMPRLLGRR